jgi:hypothetical protein
VMHETTVDTTPTVLRRGTSEKAVDVTWHHSQATDVMLQYFLTVLASAMLVKPLVPMPKHPW